MQAVQLISGEIGLGQAGCIAITGTKGIGKSGFARLLVNTLLGQHSVVAYMDTDLGQPEFTVPGETEAPAGKIAVQLSGLQKKGCSITSGLLLVFLKPSCSPY